MVLIFFYCLIITAFAAFLAGFVLGINPKRAVGKIKNEKTHITGIKDKDYESLLNYDGRSKAE